MFIRTPKENTYELLSNCNEGLQNLGLVESWGVEFVAYQLDMIIRRWWRVYLDYWLAGSPTVTWVSSLRLLWGSICLAVCISVFKKIFLLWYRVPCMWLSMRWDVMTYLGTPVWFCLQSTSWFDALLGYRDYRFIGLHRVWWLKGSLFLILLSMFI